MRRLLRFAAALVAAATITAGGLTVPAAAATEEVTVRDIEFDPDPVRIEPGDTVRWTWEDAGHTVTGPGFDSGTRTAGSSFEWTFASAGTFEYGCEIHTGMNGTVQVGPEADPLPP